MTDKTCKERVRPHFKSRMSDIRALLKAYRTGKPVKHGGETYTEESLGEYGLCFCYVAKRTFTDQKRGFFQFQISTGGSGDEFRFFGEIQHSKHGVYFNITGIQYWFLDWFDGAKVVLHKDSENFNTLLELFEYFNPEHALTKEELEEEYDE